VEWSSSTEVSAGRKCLPLQFSDVIDCGSAVRSSRRPAATAAAAASGIKWGYDRISPRERRDDMPPPADGSSTRGGSTSVRGRVRSPHVSGGRPAAGSQRAYSLDSCATRPACYSLEWDRQTDGSRYRLMPPLRRPTQPFILSGSINE